MQNNLVVAANSDIGKAIILKLCCQPNQHLILTARNKNNLRKLITQIKSEPNIFKIFPYTLDVTSEKQIKNFFIKLKTKVKTINNLFFCVGETLVLPTSKMILNDWNKIINTNLTSAFLIYKYGYNFFKENTNLIFISSIAAKDVFPNWTAYCVSKTALNKFCDCIREELRLKKVKVICVMPAATNTKVWNKIKGNWNRKNMLNPQTVAKIILQNINNNNAVTEEIIIRAVEGNL